MRAEHQEAGQEQRRDQQPGDDETPQGGAVGRPHHPGQQEVDRAIDRGGEHKWVEVSPDQCRCAERRPAAGCRPPDGSIEQ